MKLLKELLEINSNIFLNEAARKTFTTSIQEWIDFTQAKGIYVKKGKYAGTYAHYDIAFNFALYLSNNLKLYLCEKMREKNLNLKEILTKLHNNNA